MPFDVIVHMKGSTAGTVEHRRPEDGALLALHTRSGIRRFKVAPVAPRRSGHRGKAVARPAARRPKSTRGPPDDDPDPGEPAWTTFAEMFRDGGV